MDVVADESVDFGLINLLREKSINVFAITESLSGISDKEVLEVANNYKCLLITEDKDFGELVYRLKMNHHGILLVRLYDMTRTERITYISDVIVKYYDSIKDNFSVLTKLGLRIKTAKDSI